MLQPRLVLEQQLKYILQFSPPPHTRPSLSHLMSHFCLIQFPVEQVDALLYLAHLDTQYNCQLTHTAPHTSSNSHTRLHTLLDTSFSVPCLFFVPSLSVLGMSSCSVLVLYLKMKRPTIFFYLIFIFVQILPIPPPPIYLFLPVYIFN